MTYLSALIQLIYKIPDMNNRYILLSIFMIISLLAHSQYLENDKIIDTEKKAATNHFNTKQIENNSATDIIYHEIHWTVDPSKYYISGHVTSIFNITKKATSQITFDLSHPLIVDSIIHSTGKLNFTHDNSTIFVDLAKTLDANTLDTLTIYYQGEPAKQDGFGSFETNKQPDGTPILWTLSEPYGAKDWWPCKQTLMDKADSLDIYVTVPEGNKVGTNGILISENTEDNQTTYHWKHNYPIATYLIAIAVTNYAEFTDIANVGDSKTVDILNYVYPENLSSAKEDAKFTVDVMELYSKLFIPYPFSDEKYGHAQFGWGGGMEHQTMSFMGGFSKELIAHELAHQWFGDHVTCGSWADIWINEGFATYLTGLTYENLIPEYWMSWKDYNLNYVIDNAPSGSVIVDDTTSVNRIFSSALSYKKGAYFLHMLRYQIGDDKFFEGCQLLLTQPETSGKFANTKQVQTVFESVADINLTDFFDAWLYQQGYPSFKVEWLQNMEGEVDLRLIQTTTHESVFCFKMKIPILFVGDEKELSVDFLQTTADHRFTYNPGFTVNKVIFDPEYNILAPHPAWVVVDIHEDKLDEQLRLYPNPATHELIIKSNKNHIVQQIEIISNDGKHVYSEINRSQKKKFNLNIADFTPGVYYVRALINDQEVVKQFVKN